MENKQYRPRRGPMGRSMRGGETKGSCGNMEKAAWIL